MRKLLLLILLPAALFIGGRTACRALASDEQRIARLIEDMAAGFNATAASRAVRGLGADWRDPETGADRDWVRQGLIQLFLTERDPETKRFRYRAAVPREHLAVTIDPAHPDRATLTCRARFTRPGATDPELAWEIAIEADLTRTDDGWRIQRSAHETLQGERLWGR